MTGKWQKIYEGRLFCHSWRVIDERRLTAMTTLIAIAIAVGFLLILAEMLREVLADRPTHQPRSHLEDPQFRSPGAWS